MAPTPAPVLGALHLRAWALGALCGPHPPPPPPDVPAEAWRLFLGVERCGLALAPLVSAAGGPAELVADFAVAESRGVLSARGQLRRLDALARANGWRVVALKGAVPLLRGAGGAALVDLDVLVAPEHAAPLAEALAEAGYAVVGKASRHVLPTLSARGEIPVEIHRMVPLLPDAVWERVRPAPDSALLLLHPADHLRHLLTHTTLHHPERRGRIRDLLLMADALAHSSPDDVRDVRMAVLGSRDERVLDAQLVMAAAAAGRAGGGADAFELTAAGVYLAARALRDRAVSPWQPVEAWHAATRAVARRAGTPLSEDEWSLDWPSRRPALAWLRRVAPRLERAVRLLARRGRAGLLAPFSLSIAAAAEHAVRERAAQAASSVRSG